MGSTHKIGGLPVIDATEPLKLRVTKADIARASVKKPDDCAIARACRRQLHVLEARIHLTRAYLRMDDEKWVRYETPRLARDEIIAFDRGGTFEPCHLTLTPARFKIGERHPGGTAKYKAKRAKPTVVRNVRGSPA
jgi:hypothetical protein